MPLKKSPEKVIEEHVAREVARVYPGPECNCGEDRWRGHHKGCVHYQFWMTPFGESVIGGLFRLVPFVLGILVARFLVHGLDAPIWGGVSMGVAAGLYLWERIRYLA